ncbi:AAA family ATPase [Thalassotalea atypica]|uniref:AAA family ATPase n=1 Tax=Thalassotalea atypica TaxID=2054316 RepID=UPI0025734B8E|nr:MoxR family ATPase [Thalassotalea atypica]
METLVAKVLTQIGAVVMGKPHQIKLALSCLLAKGHILIEDLPGMGKTTLAQVLSKTLGLSYQRTQFTSDLMPSDVIGISIFEQASNQFVLHKGPIFNQVVLADEINRASPKTQSALLEAMEEHQVSIDGITHPLPLPFFVIATQNPLFHSGTNPLPESQLDRFMMRISIGFPSVQAEREILLAQELHQKVENIGPILSGEQLKSLQEAVENVSVNEQIIDYIIGLCRYSRRDVFNGNPLSPRAGKSLLKAAKAWAFIDNRDYVSPDDVQAVFPSVCEHRLDAGINTIDQVSDVLSKTILERVDVLNPL